MGIIPGPHQPGMGRYRLRCPSGCAVATVDGGREAARVVDEHPAACPDPGWTYAAASGGRLTLLHPLVYAERTR
jgi:hypothetical protein